MFDFKGVFDKRIDEDAFGMVKRGTVFSRRDFFTILHVARRNHMRFNDLLNNIVAVAADAFRREGF